MELPVVVFFVVFCTVLFRWGLLEDGKHCLSKITVGSKKGTRLGAKGFFKNISNDQTSREITEICNLVIALSGV